MPPRWIARWPAAGRVALSLGLLLFAQLEIWADRDRGLAASVVLAGSATLATLSLLGARRWPLLSAVAVVVGHAAGSFITGAGTPLASYLAVVVAAWSLARHAEREAALAGAAVMALGLVVHDIADPRLQELDIALGLAVAAAAWGVGRTLRHRAHAVEALQRESDRLRESEEQRAIEAVTAERARVARDLHDIVAHNVSVVAVQAGAARVILDEDVESAREALTTIERTSRDAMAELRQLLDVLRADDATALTAQRGVADLDALVGDVRAARQPVELRVVGDAVPLPAMVDLAAYRVVQEALTNVVKHAAGAPAGVSLTYRHGLLDVEITNAAPVGRGENAVRPGRHLGLVGMRERVALCEGEFHAGPREDADGGFVVRARFPLVRGTR